MRVTISSGLLDRIAALAAADPRREVCGLLVGGDGRIDDILPATNVADDPARHFEVDPKVQFDAIRAARAGGPAVIGCYHSHPSGDAVPSATDCASIDQVGDLWMICAGRDVRIWVADTPTSFAEIAFVPERAACVTS